MTYKKQYRPELYTLKSAEKFVERVLQENMLARENDIELIFAVWEKQGLKLTPQQRALVNQMYSSETITRCRRKLQEIGLYKPTLKKKIQRSLLDKQFKHHFEKEKKKNKKPEYVLDKERQVYVVR